MADYKVYIHPELGEQLVKDGFSWPGFLFTFGWAAYKNLWKHAIALGLVLAGSRLASIYFERRYDDNPQDSLAAIVIILAMVILIATCFVVGRFGNRWVENNLESRGYVYRETRVDEKPS